MPFLPIAERELRVAARKRATYRTRFWAVLLAFGAFSWQLLVLLRQHQPSAVHGERLFVTLSVVAFVYCLFIGARVTADCLSEEKREGTLGLLFLTDLKGYDIVFGKLVASSVNAFYGLIAIVPMLAICLLLGGVSFEQLAKTVFVLITVLFFSLSAGIFVSTYNRLERTAMFFTILLILLCTLGPWLVGGVLQNYFGFTESSVISILILTPAIAMLAAIEPAAVGQFPNFAFSTSLAATWILTIILLRGASLRLPNSWQEKPLKANPKNKLISLNERPARTAESEKFRATALQLNPFFWLTLRGPEKLKHAWGFVIAIIVIWAMGFWNSPTVMWDYNLLFPTILFIHAFLKIWITSEACTRLVEDRRSGAMELLLSTPLDAEEIIRGQHLALTRQFGAPLLLLVTLEIICRFGIVSGHREKLFLSSAALMLAADFFTLRWVAMWVGLNAKNVNRAILKTALLVLALPWLIYNLLNNVLPFFYLNPGQPFPREESFKRITWVAIALLTDFILYRWAKTNLLAQFRPLATQQFRSVK